MATYHAIAATSRAVLSVLEDAFPKDEFGSASFKTYHAEDFQKPMGEGTDQGFSLFLYRVTVNGSLRTFPPRIAPDGRRYKPSLPLDLHYLITPWAKDVERQQHLLAWCMRTLEDTPILPTGLLNHSAHSDSKHEAFRPNETIELICDPLSLQDMINLWENLGNKLQTSITYITRMVMVDSDLTLDDGRLVQTRDLGYGELKG